MTIKAMAMAALLGEDFRALGQGVTMQQGDGAGGGDAGRGLGQHVHALSFALRSFGGGLIRDVVPVLGHGEIREQTRASDEAPEQAEVKPVAQVPAANQWHQKNNPHDQARYNNRAPDFAGAREKFEKLK